MLHHLTTLLGGLALAAAPLHGALADEPRWQLFVWETSGQRLGYDLTDTPEVTLGDDGSLTLTTSRVTLTYASGSVEQFTINDVTVDDITVDGVRSADAARTSFRDGQLACEGLAAGTAVCLYDASGRLAGLSRADASGRARLDTASLPAGVYVVSIGQSATLKLHKK